MQTITVEMNEQDMKCLDEIKALLGLSNDEDAIKASLRFRRTMLLSTKEGQTVFVCWPNKDNEIAAVLKSTREPLQGGDYTTSNRKDGLEFTVTLPSLKEFSTVEVIKLDSFSNKLSHIKRKGEDELSTAYLSAPFMKLFGMGTLE